jgi:hypothetical protein
MRCKIDGCNKIVSHFDRYHAQKSHNMNYRDWCNAHGIRANTVIIDKKTASTSKIWTGRQSAYGKV